MNTATTTKNHPGRELSLEDLDTVAGGGDVCIGLRIKTVCLGISVLWNS